MCRILVKSSFAQMNAAGIGGRNILKKRSTARLLHTNVNVVIASVFSTLMATRIGSIVAMIAISRLAFGRIRMR